MANYWFQPHSVTLDVGGRPMTLETGRMAKQASGAVVVTYGETVVLVTCTTAKAREGIDFLPLTVDFVEKTSAAGKIPGGFFKREGRLSDREVLVSRFIDRSVRPLFAEGWRDETHIVATVLSADRENTPTCRRSSARRRRCTSRTPRSSARSGPCGSDASMASGSSIRCARSSRKPTSNSSSPAAAVPS